MKIRLYDGLPFVTATLTYRGQTITLENVLLDTGSASTLIAIDAVDALGLWYEPDDEVHKIRGVGGTEFVFTKKVDSLAVGGKRVPDFVVEVGAIDYGFALDGLIGLDFLVQCCCH